jgi:hypothetical protein
MRRGFLSINHWVRAAICALGLFAGVASASAVTLYSTSFNNPPFAAGSFWAGVDGWLATDPNNGSAAVTQAGGAVYLGWNPPSGSYSAAGRAFNLDPVALGMPIVKIRTRLVIYDSSNSHYDLFGFSLFNKAGEFLWSLVLDNSNYHAYFDPGTGLELVQGRFYNAQFLVVGLTINFATNRASLTIYDSDGNPFPVFENQIFHKSGRALNLGEFDYTWFINSSGTAGDNAMVIDALSVEAQANPALVIAKGKTQRTKRDTYILRGGQAPEDDVRVEWKSKVQWRWMPVRGTTSNWTIRLRKLAKGRNVVQLRMLDALGRTIDQTKVTVLRK